jgi:divalent metal cation (Fe/Co/Zn/Cd) transporter
MDRSVDSHTEGKMREIISKDATGALEIHDLRTRGAGRLIFYRGSFGRPATMTVSDAHIICERLEAALHENVRDCRVTIHVEPEGEARHKGVIVV